jgi:hypothetical protein
MKIIRVPGYEWEYDIKIGISKEIKTWACGVDLTNSRQGTIIGFL